jgi:hypothetical protein
MAKGVLIISPSGSGKSASMRNLKSSETVILNVADKELPFKKDNGFKDVIVSKPADIIPGAIIGVKSESNISNILKYVSSNLIEVKQIIIDDFGYVAVNEYMSRLNEKSFDKFNHIGNIYWKIANLIKKMVLMLHTMKFYSLLKKKERQTCFEIFRNCLVLRIPFYEFFYS